MNPFPAVSVSEAISHPERRGRFATGSTDGSRSSYPVPVSLACLDSLAAGAALLLVLVSVNLPHMHGGLETFLSARVSVKNVLLLVVLLTSWPVIFHLFGLYEARYLRQRFESEAGRVIAAITVGAGVASVFPLTTVSGALTIGHLPRFWLAAIVLGLLVRIGRQAVGRLQGRHARRTLIVGTGRLAEDVCQDIVADPTSRL